MGPRGTFALERLLFHLSDSEKLSNLQVLLFEQSECLGNGPVYDTEQPLTNWINISERIMHLPPREPLSNGVDIPAFPTYHEWINKDYNEISAKTPDPFPPRARVGQYLNERLQSLLQALEKTHLVALYRQEVTQVMLENKSVILKTKANASFEVDEVLLTIGHQPTEPAKQIRKWQAFTAENQSCHLFTSPYPIRHFLGRLSDQQPQAVGIRGFGLAMIDVVRAIAEKFGEFEVVNETTRALKYHTSTPLTDVVIPFSLDGLPMAPKPLNAAIDQLYKPTEEQLEKLQQILGNSKTQREAKGPSFLIEPIADTAAQIYLRLSDHRLGESYKKNELKQLITQWLEDDTFEHELITPRTQPAEESMHQFVQMATHTAKAISLDFCVGQVWRHCQPTIYDQLSFNACSAVVFAEIIALDERMKRYAYGPPVESLQQLLALHRAGFLHLHLVNDPDIELTKKGWKLSKGNHSRTVSVMIDSVLDSPRVEKVNSPIIQHLLKDDLVQVVHDNLGIDTTAQGYVRSALEHKDVPIAILGRLVKGTIIGVDAILECFGQRPDSWASTAAKRYKNRVRQASRIDEN